MVGKYSVEDIVKSYRWLGHKSYTELNAFHREYKPGRSNYGWNVEKRAFPRIWYVKTEQEVSRFVKRFCDSRTVCYSINPRPKAFTNEKGYPRGTQDKEIEVSQNLLLDFDFEKGRPSVSQLAAFIQFLDDKANSYFRDLYLQLPEWAETGRGFHLLFAYQEILVAEHPDIRQRLEKFRDQFNENFRQELSGLEVKLDHTQDLRRMVRIYGTAKPDVGVVSKFYGNGQRVEDVALHDYLLNLDLPQTHGDSFCLDIRGELPRWFRSYLKDGEEEVRKLWRGTGKPDGTDCSRSGFDYSLVRALIRLGYRNLDDLATILALRPNGAAGDKGTHYIARTISSALLK